MHGGGEGANDSACAVSGAGIHSGRCPPPSAGEYHWLRFRRSCCLLYTSLVSVGSCCGRCGLVVKNISYKANPRNPHRLCIMCHTLGMFPCLRVVKASSRNFLQNVHLRVFSHLRSQTLLHVKSRSSSGSVCCVHLAICNSLVESVSPSTILLRTFPHATTTR